MVDTRSYFEYYWLILSLFEWYQVDKPLLWAHTCSERVLRPFLYRSVTMSKFPRNQNARFDEIGVSSSIWDLKSLRCIDHWCPDSIFKPFFKIRFHVREKSSPDLWHKLISFSHNYATILVELHRITNKIYPKSLHCIDLEHPDIIFKAFLKSRSELGEKTCADLWRGMTEIGSEFSVLRSHSHPNPWLRASLLLWPTFLSERFE